jgi:hypothetical protein
MLNQSGRQSEDQSSSIAKPSQQLWTLTACPAVDHDARPEGEASSSGRPPLSPRCIVIMAAAGGIAVANLYYNQPMLPDISRSFDVAANVIAVLPMSTQIGYALGLFLFVPLGDSSIAANWPRLCCSVSSFRWSPLHWHHRLHGSISPA